MYGAEFDDLAHRWAILENEHDREHPDRNQCGGVGGCSLMFAAKGLADEMIAALTEWRRARPTTADVAVSGVVRARELLDQIEAGYREMSTAGGPAVRVYVLDGLGGKWEVSGVTVQPFRGVGEVHTTDRRARVMTTEPDPEAGADELFEMGAGRDDDHVAPDALNGGEDWREQKCKCRHERAVHAGPDGLGRCCLRSCWCHDSAFVRA